MHAETRVILVNRVYWPSASATAQLLADLAEGLAARGWNVHVVASGEASTRHNGVTVHRTGTPEQHGGLLSRALNHRRFLRAARRQLAALVQPGDTVVALTDPPMLGAMAAEAAAAQDARVIHWIQDIYPEIAAAHFGPLAGVLLSVLKWRRDRAWRNAAACVTLGEAMAQVVSARGVEPSRLMVIPNWAPRELHEPPTAEAVAERRRRWGCAGKFVVAYSGNLGRVHEFSTLLDAAARLADDPAIAFLFIGQGPRFAEVAADVQRRGLGNVRLLPPEPRSGLAAALAAADVHCVTLRPAYARLVYPSKLAGALAAGRPVVFVGSPDGDIARLLRARDCGASFPPGAADALAETLRQWRAAPGPAAQRGTRARAAYLELLTSEAALTRWETVLRTAHE